MDNKPKVLILGGDGYLGWPTAMAFGRAGYQVAVVDNYLRRNLTRELGLETLVEPPNLHRRVALFEERTGIRIGLLIGDLTDPELMDQAVRGEFENLTWDGPAEAVVHYAEQPSAPYSMRGRAEAALTLNNNLNTTLNLAWAINTHNPECHIVKLGTMGVYGTPNIDIEEGYLEIEHKGRKDRLLFPKQPGSLYHLTKAQDGDLLYFYARMWGVRTTDLNQGPVYGIRTPESELGRELTTMLSYDSIFGTVLNRFCVQAVAGVPLTVYGRGGQVRGYINLVDTIACVRLAVDNPPPVGEYRVFNQFTETFSVNQLADQVSRVGRGMGFEVRVDHIRNPRLEAEEHYYNPVHTGLVELGLEPHLLTDEVVAEMLEYIDRHKDLIRLGSILPDVAWERKK